MNSQKPSAQSFQDWSALLSLSLVIVITPNMAILAVAPQGQKTGELIHDLVNRQNFSKKDVDEAAVEIKQILNDLLLVYQPKTESEHREVATKAASHIKEKPSLKARVINACKAGVFEAVKESLDHPVVNVLAAMVNGWIETGEA